MNFVCLQLSDSSVKIWVALLFSDWEQEQRIYSDYVDMFAGRRFRVELRRSEDSNDIALYLTMVVNHPVAIEPINLSSEFNVYDAESQKILRTKNSRGVLGSVAPAAQWMRCLICTFHGAISPVSHRVMFPSDIFVICCSVKRV